MIKTFVFEDSNGKRVTYKLVNDYQVIDAGGYFSNDYLEDVLQEIGSATSIPGGAKVCVDIAATADYLGATNNVGALRVDSTTITKTDGGNYITLSVVPGGIAHNDLASKQGGTTGEYYHLTSAQVSVLHSAVTVLDSSSIDFTLTGQQIAAAVLPAGVDHNSLANLTTGDAHTMYALLAGRSGGQTLIGGTGLGDDLIFQTTSHVTKGSYIFSEMSSAGFLKNTAAGVVTGGNSIDISSDTNLAASAPIVLTGDTLSHSTANGYVHTPADGAAAQILQYSSAGTSKWATVSGDVTIADGGATTIGADKIKDTMIDWGTGAGQVSADDVPDGATNIIPTTTQETNWDTAYGWGNHASGGYLKADGTVALSADWDAGSYEIRAQTLESDVATGTAPLTIASTTLVTNLNADKWDSQDYPLTTLGDTFYGGASGVATRLAGNTTTTKKFLTQTGDGVNSAAPSWATIAVGDLPAHTHTALTSTANSTTLTLTDDGTNQTLTGNTGDLTIVPTGGDLRITGNTDISGHLAVADGTVQTLIAANITKVFSSGSVGDENISINVSAQQTAGTPSALYAIKGAAYVSNTGEPGTMRGLYFEGQMDASGKTVGDGMGAYCQYYCTAGTTTRAYGGYFACDNSSAIGTGHGGFFVSNSATLNYGGRFEATGTGTTSWGGYFQAISANYTNNYGIYAIASGGTNNWAGRFEGSYVHIGNAGTATNKGDGWLYAEAGVEIGGLTASKPLFTDANKALTSTGTVPVNQGGTGDTSYTNGQLLIGNTTGNTLTKATLTAGTGITVTNSTGSITLAAHKYQTFISFEAGSVSADQYLYNITRQQNPTNSIGILLPFAGSIVSVSCCLNCSVGGAGRTVTIKTQVGDVGSASPSDKLTTQVACTTTGNKNSYNTAAIGTHTFTTGQMLYIYADFSGTAPTVDNIEVYVLVAYNP